MSDVRRRTEDAIDGPRMSFHASELAALVGMHTYKSAKEAAVDVWRRLNPYSLYEAKRRSGVKLHTAAEMLGAAPVAVAKAVCTAVRAASEDAASELAAHALSLPLLHVDDAAVASVQQAVARRGAKQAALTLVKPTLLVPEQDHDAELRATVRTMVRDCRVAEQVLNGLCGLESGATDAQVAAVLGRPRVSDCKATAAAVTSAVNTQRGTRQEDDAIAAYEKVSRRVVHSRNDAVYSRVLCESEKCGEGETCNSTDADGDPRDVMLSGRVDGLVGSSAEKENRVVEVKCRRSRLFDQVPLYEKVQMHAYMFLTRRTCCDLVQKFGENVRITTMLFDEDFWAAVQSRARDVAGGLRALLRSHELQDSLLNAVALQ